MAAVQHNMWKGNCQSPALTVKKIIYKQKIPKKKSTMYLTFVSKYLIIQLNIWAVCAVLCPSALLGCRYRKCRKFKSRGYF